MYADLHIWRIYVCQQLVSVPVVFETPARQLGLKKVTLSAKLKVNNHYFKFRFFFFIAVRVCS